MKKIISPLVFAAVLIWTWHLVNSPSAIGFETHSGIQTKLIELIQSTLQSKKPEAKDLEITKIWTSTLSDNKVKANFAYRFTEPSEDGESTQKTIQGEAVLYREPTEDPTVDKWVLQSVKSQLESMSFNEGSTVVPDETLGAEPTKETPSEEKHE